MIQKEENRMKTNYKKLYEEKLMSLEEAAKLIQSGNTIVANPVTGFPSELSEAITDRYKELNNIKLVSLFALKPYPFLTNSDVAEKIHYETMFLGPLERKLYDQRLFDVNSINFSDMAKHVTERVKPDIFMAQVGPMDEDGYFNVGPHGVMIGRESANVAKKIFVQVNNEMVSINKHLEKKENSDFLLHISEIDVITEKDAPLLTIPSGKPTELEETIANHIVPMIEEGATLQIGFGGLSNAVSYGLIGKVNGCKVHTEMITESMMDLSDKGVVTGSIVGGFSLGSQKLYEWTASNNRVELQPLSVVNNSNVIRSIDKFYSINATLMADLTGQITSEAIGTRQVSSVGGAGDFVRGATHSNDGKSFVCVASSYKDKDGQLQSNIVFSIPPATPITVPRQDIMYIVTEYGVADIFNLPISERVKRMIAIAHPDFREELTLKAKEAGYIK